MQINLGGKGCLRIRPHGVLITATDGEIATDEEKTNQQFRDIR